MAGALTHRGPDEFGCYRDDHVALVHARLSIIDLTSGQQPLTNEDGSLWIVFNGEIFNYVELRDELTALGHRFSTRSDTEVIVHAYEQWGEEAFARFNGQWAVALWDSRARRLVLSRDRYGICPLYTMEHQGRLHFASELKAIFWSGAAVERALDPRGIDQTFTFWSIVPPRSVFSGVEEVRPGEVVTFDEAGRRARLYWQPRYPATPEEFFPGTEEEAVEAVEAALERATRLRLERSDVPVACYLSGGLDSSIVSALGRRVKRDELKTFSLRFEDAEFDETAHQRRMVEALGTDHAEVVVGRDDIAAAFERVVLHTERPILRTAPAPLMLLSGLVREHGIKVVLTGEGADEMFAGYDIFREAKVRRFWARRPDSTWRPLLLERLYPYLARSPVAQRAMARKFFGRDLERWRQPGFSHLPRWHTTASIKRLYCDEMKGRLADYDARVELLDDLPEDFEKWEFLAQDQYLETRTLLSGYLLSSQGDRMLSANSVEGRYPFLDSEVIELANSLPARYKLKVLDEKHVLKRMARRLIPEQILQRKKQPYRAPDAVSFAGLDGGGWVSELLDEERVARCGVFDPKAVAQLWRKCRRLADQPHRVSNADNMALVAVISTQLLHRHFVEREQEPPMVDFGTCIDRRAAGSKAGGNNR